MPPIIDLKAAGRVYQQGPITTEALRPTTLSVEAGAFIAVTGASGSGKSTFLNLISGIDRPTCGEVLIAGTSLNSLSESRLAHFRGSKIGIVFQFFELIQTLTALENIVLAMDLVGTIPSGKRKSRALDLLGQMGLKNHAGKLPSRLSGGEQQRVAIARALANDPEILIADEPTGNLDQKNGEMVATVFGQCAADGRTVIVATHEYRDLSRYDRVLRIADGAFVTEAVEVPA